ncbi:MAG: electron transfer flavoprotein-ubiquinone oxidoreductase [Pseudomonadota bacterium]|nr:electron transfer flavoprotein-ubiquinone oxidoreductase [Pseudomonadota bacterium]
MEYDVVIVGAGPAGLSAAIRLRQLSQAAGKDISVCILEKGSTVGAHILSGAVLEPRALNELIPDWKSKGAPLTVPVTGDRFLFLTEKRAFRLPTPPQMHNQGNYIISLGHFCVWLAKEAEALGVQIFPGFPAADMIIENGRVTGVMTGEFGVARDGSHKSSYQPGMAVKGKYTLLAEGCRGSLSERLMKQFNLRAGAQPQTYGIGIKELWEIDPAKHKAGLATHSVGWPLDGETYGGSFMYHGEGNKVAVGFVVGLDYRNPHLNPFEEFQRFKTHPALRGYFEGARRICYGARALNEGGFQSIPGLAFSGGALIGDSAGFMSVPKLKGIHTSMKSAMLAAEATFAALVPSAGGQMSGDRCQTGHSSDIQHPTPDICSYPASLKKSWVYSELYRERNIRPGFRFGLIGGLAYAAIDTYILRGRAPWTLSHRADHAELRDAARCKKIVYAKPDGKLSFDRLSSVFLSSTNHEENQPCHLTLKDPKIPIEVNLPRYAGPESRYCPAGVYEFVDDLSPGALAKGEGGAQKLRINAPNCVHCKTCDIKDPEQNIVWVTPEGGGGPNYSGM